MKKAQLVLLLSTILIISATSIPAFCANTADAHGPAPNSSDSISDGSGYDPSDWPNDDSPGMGPAPNSGDCFPDGSGF